MAVKRPPTTPLPWKLPVLEDAEILAIQALAAGDANALQQKRAWRLICERLCAADAMTFWPGEDGRRATDFAEGKRWVAIQLRRISRLVPAGLSIRDEPPPMPVDEREGDDASA